MGGFFVARCGSFPPRYPPALSETIAKNIGAGFAEILIVQSHPVKVPYPYPAQQWWTFGGLLGCYKRGYWRTSVDKREGDKMARSLAR